MVSSINSFADTQVLTSNAAAGAVKNFIFLSNNTTPRLTSQSEKFSQSGETSMRLNGWTSGEVVGNARADGSIENVLGSFEDQRP